MAERIVIAELELNTKALQESNAKLIQDISKLREEQKTLRKETGNLTNASEQQARKFVENDAALKKLNSQYNSNKKVIAESLTGVKNLNNELSREIKNVDEATASNKRLKALRNQINQDTEGGQKALAEINAKIDQNSEFIKGNVSQLEQQKIGIGGYEEGIISALSKVELFGVNLGDLTKKGFEQVNSIKQQIAAQKANTTTTQASAKAQAQLATSQNLATAATSKGSKALKLFRLALISTGIGAIVVLLGTLVSALSQSERFTDLLTKAFAPLKGAFGAIIGIIQDLATNFKDIVKGAFQQFKDNFIIITNTFLNGVAKMRVAWNKLTGDTEEANELQAKIDKRQQEINQALERTVQRANAVKEAFKEGVDRIKEGADAQREIVDLGIQIENAENRLIIRRSELNKLIKEQNKIAEDITRTQAEREAAAIKSIEASKQLVAEEQKILDLKIKQKTLENSINETSREDQKELNALVAERNDKETQGLELQTTQTNKLNQIRREAESKRQKAVDNAIKKSKEELDLYIAQNREITATLAERLKAEEDIRDKRLTNLKKELDAGKISQTKYETDVLNIKREFLAKQAELTVENLDRQIQSDSVLLENRILNEELTNNQIFNLRLESLDRTNELELEKLKEQFDAKLLSQEEYNLLRLEKENEYLEAKNTLEDENELLRREEKAVRDELQREEDLLLLEEQSVNDFTLELERIAQEEEAKKLYYDQLKADGLISEANYQKAISNLVRNAAQQRTQIEAAAQNSKLQGQVQVAQGVAQIAGQESAVGKAAGIAAATIDTYRAASLALATIPPPFGAIQAGISIATGLANVAKIVGVKGAEGVASGLGSIASGVGSISAGKLPKAEKGALFGVGGKRHSQGGTKFYGEDGTAFEAEKGELIGVMNRNASKLFMDFNDKYGSGGIVSRNNVFSSGGIVARQNVLGKNVDASINYEVLGESVAEANRQLPNPVVAVTDINDGQGSYTEVVDGANIS